MTISLNKNDRIRLIHVPDNVIATVEETVRLNWRRGIQEVSDKRPALFEIKLRGHPWWADGMVADSAQKWSFPLRISSWNDSVSCGFCHNRITEEIVSWELHFLCSGSLVIMLQNLLEISKLHLPSWCRSFLETQSFSYVANDSDATLQKLAFLQKLHIRNLGEIGIFHALKMALFYQRVKTIWSLLPVIQVSYLQHISTHLLTVLRQQNYVKFFTVNLSVSENI